jgi:hypothetical protein
MPDGAKRRRNNMNIEPPDDFEPDPNTNYGRFVIAMHKKQAAAKAKAEKAEKASAKRRPRQKTEQNSDKVKQHND